ncbi:MAG TPA: hypothetical protein VG204_03525 [Terriglobia bacterium]|nr:hypothetical protein [Terriglobia bacterium]
MMKTSNQRQKLVAAILGLVCVALLINLLRSPYIAGGPSSPPSPGPNPRVEHATPAARSPAASAKLSSYEPEVQLETLSQLNLRPLPPVNRNPFVYGPTPAEIQAQKDQTVKNNQPPPPPPPPPITVKALGFEQGPGDLRKAFFSDTAETPEAPAQTYQATEGQSFADHYKVLQITSTEVTIEDQSSHVKAQLPFPD